MSTPTYAVFDADARQEARSKAGLLIGGKQYPRRRRNNKLQREIRRIGREQQKLLTSIDEARNVAEQDRLLGEIADLTTTDDDGDQRAKLEKLQAELQEVRDGVDLEKVDDLQEAFDHTLYRLLVLNLAPAEDGSELTADALAELLDIEDAGDLSRQLLGTGKPAEDEPDVSDEPDPT